MKKTMAVIGCHGLLGQNLVTRAPNLYNLVGMDLSQGSWLHRSGFTYLQGDITSKDGLAPLREVNPDIIVNCAAYTAVDRAESERDLCWKLNHDAVRNLAGVARTCDAHLIHISTDYVFDGVDGPYHEDDRPNPLSVYGKSKLAAENLIRGEPITSTILRTMVLYGKGIQLKTDFVAWALGELSAGREITVVNDQMGNTTYVNELVRAIMAAVRHEVTGVLHAASQDVISRFDFTRLLAAEYGLDPELVKPITTASLNQPAPRPLNSGLRVSETERKLRIRFLKSRDGLRKYKQENPHTHRLN